jgi:hypothetical protein
VIALLFAVVVNCPGDDVSEVLADSPYSAAQRSQIMAVIESAAAEGYPLDGLRSRLVEGLAKNVTAETVESALRSDVGYLEGALAVLSASPQTSTILDSAPAWERAANLLRAGWSEDNLVVLARICGDRPEVFREATTFYVTLIEWGAEHDDAVRLTDATIHSRLSPDSFPQITAVLGQAQRRRIPADQAVEMVVDALVSGRSIRQIRAMFSR